MGTVVHRMRPRRGWLLVLIGLYGCAPPPAQLGPDGIASVSGPLALSPDGGTLWVVNPDANTITPIDTRALTAGSPLPVGGEPWSVAVTPGGSVVVTNRLDGSVTVLADDARHDVVVGPEPGGLALSPTGRFAYVTVSSDDEVAIVDLRAREVVERLPVGRLPWAVAVSDDGDRVDGDEVLVVSHRLPRLRSGGREGTNDGKEGWLTLLGPGGRREVALPPNEFGYPTALEGLALRGDRVWVSHLLNRPELPRDFDKTVSGGLTRVPSTSTAAAAPRTLHLNDAEFSTPTNFPRAVAVAPDGSAAYLALAGTNAVMGVSLADPDAPELLGFWPTGLNPRGIVVEPSGERAFVMNHLSRDVSVLDLTDREARRELARVVVSEERLEPEIARGKVLFNNANDPRVSHLGWISCASCHLDGGVDGTTWATPDGPRQTMPLWQLARTAPFHASATRDEVADFEHDIEGFMGGSGLAPRRSSPELGDPNGGRSADLDALEAYVLRGIRVPRAAEANAAISQRGRAVFDAAGCATCHAGADWTVSRLPGPVGTLAPDGEVEVGAALRDVGTFRAGRDVLGADGFDVPSLLGLHASAPYLHDGAAVTLAEVVAEPEHGGSDLAPGDAAALVAFLKSIDASTPTWSQGGVATGAPPAR